MSQINQQATVTVTVDSLNAILRRIKDLEEASRLVKATVNGMIPRIITQNTSSCRDNLLPPLKVKKKA